MGTTLLEKPRTTGKLTSPTGTLVEWSTESEEQIRAAREKFDEAIAQGKAAFAVKGAESERVDTFDPEREEIVVVPWQVGG
jgi:hypothetical protein